jgi:hypothetical protein
MGKYFFSQYRPKCLTVPFSPFMLTGMHVFRVDFESPRASRYTSEFQGDSSMSKVLICAASLLCLFSGFSQAAVVNFTTTTLTGAYSGNFGKITGGDPSVFQQTFNFSGPASLLSASAPYQDQLKSTATNPNGGAAVGYGVGTVSASVAFKNNLGFQVAISSTVDTNDFTQVWTSGTFSFVVDTTTNYSFTSAAGNTSGNLDSAQNYITLKNGALVMGASGSLTAGTTYTVEFMSYASMTQSPTSFNQGGKTAYLESQLDFTGTTPPVVPEPASMAVFGMLGFAGFAARRFRKK